MRGIGVRGSSFFAAVAAAGALLGAVGQAAALDRGDILLSQSTFIYLADPDTRALDPYNFAYLPAGARLRYEGATVTEFGKRRFLVHSETGSFGYIREDQIWDLAATATPTGKLGIFQRKYRHAGNVNNMVNFEIHFSRGERYVVLDREIDSWLLQVDLGEKFTDDQGKPLFELTPGTKILLKISVPTDYLTVVDSAKLGGGETGSAEPGTDPFPPLFKKSIVDGIAGIEKPCNTKNNRVIRTSVGGGFDVEKFFVSLGFSAKQETEDFEEFSEAKNVTRTYYTRRGHGTYRLTQYTDCASGHYEYSFVKPGNDEVSITKTWAEQNKLGLDSATGKVKVTCPPQYFAFEDALLQRGFDRAEAAFIISKIARWRNLSDGSCS